VGHLQTENRKYKSSRVAADCGIGSVIGMRDEKIAACFLALNADYVAARRVYNGERVKVALGMEILSNAVCHAQGIYVRTAGCKASSIPFDGVQL
jgi:hypothetical protein